SVAHANHPGHYGYQCSRRAWMCQNPNVVYVPYTAKTAPGISIIHIIDLSIVGAVDSILECGFPL
ncbi:hypothetical protein, partial [Niveispirillum sp.]|uniref:hypothetical protein n=1 Tax=Niveispirillum sp. TaxID=1917217 RepID=UPI001B72790D